MWKDFFYYSKGERRAVWVLLTLIALFVMAIVLLPEYHSRKVLETQASDSIELRKFAAENQKKPRGIGVSKNTEISVRLVEFDPNLADSIELSRLGLSKFVVQNILKYRQKGGKFASPESLSRIYGLTEEKFQELKPYIRISKTFVRKAQKAKPVWKDSGFVVQKRDTFQKAFKYPEGTKVDVNRADTSELKKVPGIGSVIARMIVAYRDRLGGFCSLEQLLEVKYVNPELLEWFKLGGDSIRKLPINQVGLEILRAHPYLNFYQAKVIMEHRRNRGEIKSLSQLSLYEEFSEKDLKRLSAYISFD